MTKRPRRFERFRPPTKRLSLGDDPRKEVNPLRATPEYKAFHKEMINDNPVCAHVDCNRASSEIHHIKRVADFPDRVYDPRNVICVCRSHHHQIESAVNRGIEEYLWAPKFEGMEDER